MFGLYWKNSGKNKDFTNLVNTIVGIWNINKQYWIPDWGVLILFFIEYYMFKILLYSCTKLGRIKVIKSESSQHNIKNINMQDLAIR